MSDNEQLTNESSQNFAVQSQHPSQELPLNRPPSNTLEKVILLMDSNGKYIDSKKFCPPKSVKHIYSHCSSNSQSFGSPSRIVFYTGTNDTKQSTLES